MINIINLELSKRLAPYLKDREIEYRYYNKGDNYILLGNKCETALGNYFKALSLEEAIEFLPSEINGYLLEFYKCMNGSFNIVYVKNNAVNNIIIDRLAMWNGKTLLLAIEKMLDYLLTNNLLKND